jgi:hypothetical protein
MTKADNLPVLLRERGRFCVWRYETRDGHKTKVPINPKAPTKYAHTDDRSTFADFQTAMAAAEKYGFDGVGVGVFDNLAGIDIDHCITDGKLSPMARSAIEALDAYTEVSPSGEGVRILFLVPSGFTFDRSKYYIKNSDIGLEVYLPGMTNRFLTVTGNVIRARDMENRADRLQSILDQYMLRPQEKRPMPAEIPAAVTVDISDAELIEKAKAAKNGDRFTRLWTGDIAGFKSQSEADQALCNQLAFWTGRDPARMDRLFRQSGLMRDKWDRRQSGTTYGDITIRKAIDGCSEVYTPTHRASSAPQADAPANQDADAKQGKKKSKPRLTRQALASEMAMRGYFVRYNTISCEYEIVGRTPAGRAMSQEDLVVLLHDALADDYSGVTFDNLMLSINFEAREHEYNPVLDKIEHTTWDGGDRLGQVYALLGIEEDELSQALVYRWLLQTVALLFNDMGDPFGAEGCLVLKGEQGVGKTSFFRHLAMSGKWFGEGMNVDERDKDTTRRIVSTWIAELGEVESTLKSDISKLKAFISMDVDHYRLPYGKADIVAPRMTSLCATCNSDRYLIDQTGNRRWLSVPIERTIPRDELLALDAPQLWAQIYATVAPMTYQEKAACFRLSPEEREKLDIRNGDYLKPLKAETEVADILAIAEEKELPTRRMTATEFISYWEPLKKYSAQQIGIALKKCGVEVTHTKTGRFAELPVPVTTAR